MYYVNENIKDLYRVKFHDEREHVLRLDMNENPQGLPREVFDVVMSKITPEYIATYPMKDRLVERLAEHNEIAFENISVTAGSDEAMRLIFQCYAESGKKLVTVTPTFEMYGVYANMYGMRHILVEYQDDFTVDVDDILSVIDDETGIVILLNPNSPIGFTYEEEDIRRIIARTQEVGAIVVVDEAYHYFYAPTCMPMVKEYDNLLVLRTFSKLFSMAGLRIGYVAGAVQLIDYVEKAESTFNVNNIALLFAMEVLEQPHLIEQLIKIEREGREWLVEQLEAAGYRYCSMEGNYVLFYPKKQSGEIVNALKEENIWIRDYGRGILKGWLRVSTGSKECMKTFWEAFVKIDG